MTPRTTFLRARVLGAPSPSWRACSFDLETCGFGAPEDGGSSGVVCGRPFLVQGTLRLARVGRDSDWPTRLSTIMIPREESIRQDLVAHHATLGLMEHASIAAFGRFTLQLLSVGAPVELIEASHRAQLDEMKHARVCFALCSAYAGRPMGPGPLPLAHALDDSSWETLFETTVLEGCIGETRAALEATWAAERCVDPVVRSIFEEISDDEARHAELAWQTARWMVRARPELMRLVPRLFGSTERIRASDSRRPSRARPWGILSDDELTACWDDAWAEIITPCARALLRSISHSREPAPDETRRSA